MSRYHHFLELSKVHLQLLLQRSSQSGCFGQCPWGVVSQVNSKSAFDLPATTVWQSSRLIGALRCLTAYPGLDICRVMHVFIVCQDIDILHKNVDNRRVLEILSKTTNGDSVPPVACQLSLESVLGIQINDPGTPTF